jgi:hypothetical protein
VDVGGGGRYVRMYGLVCGCTGVWR